MKDELKRFGRKHKLSNRGIITALFDGTEENHEEPHSGQLLSQLIFGTSISHLALLLLHKVQLYYFDADIIFCSRNEIKLT
jgi:hypothetical protein